MRRIDCGGSAPSCGLETKRLSVNAPTGTVDDVAGISLFDALVSVGRISAAHRAPRHAQFHHAANFLRNPRTQRVHWMQRVMSVAISGPYSCFSTTRFSSLYAKLSGQNLRMSCKSNCRLHADRQSSF